MNGFRCIAIETATSHCSVAVCDGDRVDYFELADSRATSRQLYSVVRESLSRVGLAMSQLDCIAFGCGPGSFTGVRVAAAAAQALAFSQDLPVCRVSSLAAIAVGAQRQGCDGPVAVAVDARMGEAYVGVYDVHDGELPVELLSDRLARPADFLLTPYADNIVAAGNGWQVWPEMRDNNAATLGIQMPDLWPDAISVLSVARIKFATGDVVKPADALPNYVRERVTQ